MTAILTRAQYNKARKMVNANNEASQAWRDANKTNGIPVEICNTFPYAKQVTNDLRSSIEVYEFINTPPDKYFLYINEKDKSATTWTGQNLGSVSFGRSYHSNMGDKRIPVSIRAINGKKYSGIYYASSGSYARVKACK